MAIVMLINAETVRDGLQYLDDVVGVFEDSHQFSKTELEKFNFLTIGGTKANVELRLFQITPDIQIAYQWASDGKYHWTDGVGETITGTTDVYQIERSNKWYKLVNDFKFPVNVGELIAEEKQLVETYDITHPSVDSFIRKLAKDVTSDPANSLEIKELKNTHP